MSLSAFDALVKAIPAAAGIKAAALAARAEAVKAKVQFPDMATYFDARIAEADDFIAKLDSIVTPEGMAALAVTIVHELAGLKHGLSPKPHAGDVTGG